MKFEDSLEIFPMDVKLSQVLKEVFQAYRTGDFVLAEALAEKALELDFEDMEVQAALKCAVYWKDKAPRLAEIKDRNAQADFLFKEYQGFKTRFVPRLGSPLEEGLYNLRQWVFGRCSEIFQSEMEAGGSEDPGLFLKLGKSYKGLGEFDKAVSALEKALGLHREDAETLSELADCYDQISEPRMSKVLFREAFYINPQKVDLPFLESPMIRTIVKHLEDRDFTSSQMKEWIPVYGTILGVFNVKRELRPLELGQLKQSIFALKNELQETKDAGNLLLPRLLNRYFWLVDHYVSVKEERGRIEEVLLNIKILDSSIYEQYIH